MGERKIKNTKETIECIFEISSRLNILRTKLEKEIGVSSGLLSRWKDYKTAPSADKIFMLLEYLNIDVIFSSEMIEDDKKIETKKEEQQQEEKLESRQISEQMILQHLNGELESNVAKLICEILFSNSISMKEKKAIWKGLNYFLMLKEFSQE